MISRAHWLLAPTMLLCACAPQAVSQPPPEQPEPGQAEPGPTEGVPQAAPEAEPPAPPPPAFESPPAPLAWDKEIERTPLPNGHGTIVLGASACDLGQRSLLLRREKSGRDPLQTEVNASIGCLIGGSPKGWTTSSPGEAGEIRVQLSSLSLDAQTVAIVLDIEGGGSDDPLVLSRADSLALVETGRLSESTTDLYLAGGQLMRVLRSNGRRDFLWYDAYAISVGPGGELVETPRAIPMARTKSFDTWDEAAPASEALIGSCPQSASRIALLEVFKDDGTEEYWVGIPTLTPAAANAAVRELKACGQAAGVVTRPARKHE